MKWVHKFTIMMAGLLAFLPVIAERFSQINLRTDVYGSPELVFESDYINQAGAGTIGLIPRDNNNPEYVSGVASAEFRGCLKESATHNVDMDIVQVAGKPIAYSMSGEGLKKGMIAENAQSDKCSNFALKFKHISGKPGEQIPVIQAKLRVT